MKEQVVNRIAVSQEWDFEELLNNLWSDGYEHAKEIKEAGKSENFMCLLKEFKDCWELIKINDFLWFDFDYIKEQLGMKDEETDDE